jgi:ribosomal protein S18
LLETNLKLLGTNKKKANCGKRLKHPDLEEFLIKWFNTMRREKKLAVTYSMLQSQAIRFCQNQDYSDINISKGFICKFMHRNKIVKRKITHYSQKDSSQFTQVI